MPAQAVAGPFDVNHNGMMQQSVKQAIACAVLYVLKYIRQVVKRRTQVS